MTARQIAHRLAWLQAMVAAILATSLVHAAPPAPLTNQDVVALVASGLPDAVIVAKVQTSDCRFDTSPDALVQLRASHVPDTVLLAMVQAGASADRAPATSSSPPNAAAADSDGKTRVFVTDSQSWETHGYSWLHGNEAGLSGGSVSKGGARPQTVEIIKTVGERCPGVIVTNQPPRANYILSLDHEGGKGLLRVRNKVVVFDRNGDSIFSDSTLTLGESVQRACEAIKKNSSR
jgi:hypothetical protein